MGESFKAGDCVRIPDGRIGRVREVMGPHCRVREVFIEWLHVGVEEGAPSAG